MFILWVSQLPISRGGFCTSDRELDEDSSKGNEIGIPAGVGVGVISQKKPSKTALKKSCALFVSKPKPMGETFTGDENSL